MLLLDRIYLVGSGSGGFGITDAFDCHVYLVDGGEEAALVDAGIGRNAEALVANAGRAVDVGRIRQLILTHAHPDHCGGAAALKQLLPGLRVTASPDVGRWVAAADERAMSLERGKLAEFYPADFSFTACPVDQAVSDGEIVEVGELGFQVLDTPGHAQGHISLLCRVGGRKALFCGDVVFFGGLISLVNNWDCRIQDYAASVAKLARLGVDALLPGHHSVSLSDGRRHIDSAARSFERGFVPRSIV